MLVESWHHSYLYDTMADCTVWLAAHEQKADYHDHGDGYSDHQQSDHSPTVKCLQCIRLLGWKKGGK